MPGGAMLIKGLWVAGSPADVGASIKTRAQTTLAIAPWKLGVPFFGGGFLPAALDTQRSRIVLHVTLDDKQDMQTLFKRCNALINEARLNGGILLHGFGDDGLKDCLVFVMAFFLSLGQKYKHAKSFVDGKLGFQSPMNQIWQHNLSKFEETAVGVGEAAKVLRKKNAHIFGERLSDWEERKDAGSGATFYYNKESGESSWEKPEDFDGPLVTDDATDTGDYFQGTSLGRGDSSGGGNGGKYAPGASLSWAGSKVRGPMARETAPDAILSCCCPPGSTNVCMTADSGGRLTLWNLKSGRALFVLSEVNDYSGNDPVTQTGLRGFAFAPSGDRILTVATGQAKVASLWRHAKEGGVGGAQGKNARKLREAQLAKKDTRELDKDTTNQRLIKDFGKLDDPSLEAVGGKVRRVSVGFLGDGTKLFYFVLPQGAASIWRSDRELGSAAAKFAGDSEYHPLWTVCAKRGDFITDMASNAESTLFATCSREGEVRLYDSSMKSLGQLIGHSGEVRSVAFSAKSTTLATAGGMDKTVKIWSLEDGAMLFNFTEHTKHVGRVLFHPSQDELLLSCGGDGLVLLWHTGAGRRIATIVDHKCEVLDMHIAEDGYTLLTSNKQGKFFHHELYSGNKSKGAIALNHSAPIYTSFEFIAWTLEDTEDERE